MPLVNAFLTWRPIPPKSAKSLAQVSARLCRLLRDEMIEEMRLGSPGLTGLAADWRKLLFPDATDERFADGYAQAVTFGAGSWATNIRASGLVGPHRRVDAIQPDHWPAEYTSDLLDLLNVLGRLVGLEPAQAALLTEIYAGTLVTVAALREAGAIPAEED